MVINEGVIINHDEDHSLHHQQHEYLRWANRGGGQQGVWQSEQGGCGAWSVNSL